ncbi:MAG: hypothetical protein GX660_20325 [Clostridiaceae bacterium]|nr:hypothetical protein [Clostridiaceae bacterium]
MRSLKVKENIITHVLSILFLVDYGFILVVFSKTAAMTVWAMGLILIISSMFFVNRVVLLYSSIGCLTFSIICYFKIPTMSVKFEVDDHIGRIGILIIATMLAVIANKQYRKRLTDNFNQLENINKANEYNNMLIINIRNTVEQLASISAQVEKLIDESSHGLKDIFFTSGNILVNSRDTVASIEYVENDLKILNENTRFVSDNVNNATESLNASKDMVNISKDKVLKFGNTMNLISDSVDEVNVSINQLYNNAGEIESAISKISEISNNTNLLSLNASIEAAKAGEYGRGFSVVAGEIRKLADNTRQLSSNISDTTRNMQQSLNSLIELFSDTTHKVGAGVEETKDITEMMIKIAESIAAITKKMNEINQYTLKQQEFTDDIGSHVNNVSELAGKTNEGITSITKVIEEVSSSINEINNAASIVVDTVNKLDKISS